MLRLACAEAADWNATSARPLSVSVNLSPRQVTSPGIAAMVADVLAQTGLDPALLTLEITEGVLVTDSEATAQTLIDLAALGLRLVLDDFGTGYSSLAYLRRFPIDGLKIDRRFIAAMDTSTEDRTIVEAIVNMAAGLQIEVVAEGVETIGQADSLVRLGCASLRVSTTRGRCRPTTWRRCSAAASRPPPLSPRRPEPTAGAQRGGMRRARCASRAASAAAPATADGAQSRCQPRPSASATAGAASRRGSTSGRGLAALDGRSSAVATASTSARSPACRAR